MSSKRFNFTLQYDPEEYQETIVSIKYVSSGTVMTSLTSYDIQPTNLWSSLPQRINRDVDINAPLQSLYTSQIPLKRAKWNDLQSLKSVIPKDYYTYYDNLPKF